VCVWVCVCVGLGGWVCVGVWGGRGGWEGGNVCAKE